MSTQHRRTDVKQWTWHQTFLHSRSILSGATPGSGHNLPKRDSEGVAQSKDAPLRHFYVQITTSAPMLTVTVGPISVIDAPLPFWI